ncbi:MAG: glycine cleavage system protein GcvH [Pseudomonadota bacterium]
MKYTEEHEWLRVDGDNVVVGVTQYAADQMGDVVFVELPDADTEISKGDEVVVIESVKVASDILAPLDGTIVEVNSELGDTPDLVNSDPLGAGWIVKMKLKNPSELDGLMDEAAYNALIA